MKVMIVMLVVLLLSSGKEFSPLTSDGSNYNIKNTEMIDDVIGVVVAILPHFVLCAVVVIVDHQALPDVRRWCDAITTEWNFTRIIPAHYDAPIRAGPREFRKAFDFAYQDGATEQGKEGQGSRCGSLAST